jgi:TrmH family RNA methyltransferase
VITSVANREIRAVRRLRLAQNRVRLGFVLVEGRVAVTGLLDAGGLIDRLIVTPRAERNLGELQRRALANGARRIVVSDDLMMTLCDATTPPSILAIAPRPVAPIRAPMSERWCGLAIGSEHDPRALGAMLRAAAACGVDLVGTDASCADPWAPKVVRASAAAAWRTEVHERIDISAWSNEAAADGATVATLGEGLPAPVGLPARFLLVTGPEAASIPGHMRLEVAETTPAMPVSVTVSHVLADWARQHPR